jgi:protein-arginine kinase activator protein McsA
VTNLTNANAVSPLTRSTRTCPRCGMTEAMLHTEGLLGCSTCYTTFEDLVAQAAETLHGVTLSSHTAPIDSAPQVPPAPVATVTRKKTKTLSWLPRRYKIG